LDNIYITIGVIYEKKGDFMKKFNKILVGIMAVMMLCAGSVGLVSCGKSGTCGKNINWKLDDEGTLTISGKGDMPDYSVISEYDEDTVIDTPWFNKSYLIERVVINDGITSIGDYSFCLCENLKSVKISDSVKEIGNSAFSNCYDIKEITIPDGVVSIGDFAFFYCKYVSITIPDSVTIIGDDALAYNNLEEITFSENVKSIGERIFFNCFNLRKVTILNTECKVDNLGRIEVTICGYKGSTAQKCAEKYGYNFEVIE